MPQQQNKINYQKELEKVLDKEKERVPTLLLHSCCAPCSSYVLEYLAQYGLHEEHLLRTPSQLSGGELQRFCIARALGERTRFLIADEISTMLDPITQSQIWNFLLAEVKERKIGLLVVSHDEKLMEQVCDRIMRL